MDIYLECNCEEPECNAVLYLVDGVLTIGNDGQVCSLSLPEWLENAIRDAFYRREIQEAKKEKL